MTPTRYVSKALIDLRSDLEEGIRMGEREVQKRRRDEVPGEWAQGVVDASRRVLTRLNWIIGGCQGDQPGG